MAKYNGKVVVILFGSRARKADYDVFVVVEKIRDYWKELESMYHLKPRFLEVDVVLAEEKDVINYYHDDVLTREALKGKWLHDGLKLKEKLSRVLKTS